MTVPSICTPGNSLVMSRGTILCAEVIGEVVKFQKGFITGLHRRFRAVIIGASHIVEVFCDITCNSSTYRDSWAERRFVFAHMWFGRTIQETKRMISDSFQFLVYICQSVMWHLSDYPISPWAATSVLYVLLNLSAILLVLFFIASVCSESHVGSFDW